MTSPIGGVHAEITSVVQSGSGVHIDTVILYLTISLCHEVAMFTLKLSSCTELLQVFKQILLNTNNLPSCSL